MIEGNIAKIQQLYIIICRQFLHITPSKVSLLLPTGALKYPRKTLKSTVRGCFSVSLQKTPIYSSLLFGPLTKTSQRSVPHLKAKTHLIPNHCGILKYSPTDLRKLNNSTLACCLAKFRQCFFFFFFFGVGNPL